MDINKFLEDFLQKQPEQFDSEKLSALLRLIEKHVRDGFATTRPNSYRKLFIDRENLDGLKDGLLRRTRTVNRELFFDRTVIAGNLFSLALYCVAWICVLVDDISDDGFSLKSHPD